MTTKKELQDEIDSIRAQLYQEREDNGNYIRHLRQTAFKIACERTRIKMILTERNGSYEALEIIRIVEYYDGIDVVVAV